MRRFLCENEKPGRQKEDGPKSRGRAQRRVTAKGSHVGPYRAHGSDAVLLRQCLETFYDPQGINFPRHNAVVCVYLEVQKFVGANNSQMTNRWRHLLFIRLLLDDKLL